MDARSGARVWVLTNYGANDVMAMPTEATWKATAQSYIDQLVAYQAGARIYFAKPWRRGYAANCATLAGWIDDIVAANPGVAFVGHNENVWLEGGDDGATMTTDGVHYSEAGNAAVAALWKTIVGL